MSRNIKQKRTSYENVLFSDRISTAGMFLFALACGSFGFAILSAFEWGQTAVLTCLATAVLLAVCSAKLAFVSDKVRWQ